MAKKISFLSIIKVIIALIPIGIKIYKQIDRKKDEKEKSEFLKALRDGDVDTLHKLLGDLSDTDSTGPGGGSEDSSEIAERKL